MIIDWTYWFESHAEKLRKTVRLYPIPANRDEPITGVRVTLDEKDAGGL